MPGAITLPGNNGVSEPPLGVTGILTTHNSTHACVHQISWSFFSQSYFSLYDH